MGTGSAVDLFGYFSGVAEEFYLSICGSIWGSTKRAEYTVTDSRTLNQIYTFLGRVLEKQANRTAHGLGLSPHAKTQKIKSDFGNGGKRVLQLQLLRDSMSPELGKHCCKLMKYTLPTESTNTQCQAFKEIVDLATLFPGLRLHFLRANCMNNATSTDTISALWDRSTGPPSEEWTFWQTLAAVCLSDTTISVIVEESSIPQLTGCDEGRLSLNTVARLQIFTGAICIRYLGGILDFPGFWSDMGSVHSDIVRKLCCEMVRVLKDIGCDLLTLGPNINEEADPPFDYDGVDFLATTLLIGMSNCLPKLDPEDSAIQPLPRSAELLPNSSTCATLTFEKILPTVYRDAEFSVVVDGEDKTLENGDMVHDRHSADLNHRTYSRSSVDNTMEEDHDTKDPESPQDDDSDVQSQGSGIHSMELRSQNEADITRTSCAAHTQIGDSEIDSPDITTPGHDYYEFMDISDPMAAQMPDYPQTGNGQLETSIDNPNLHLGSTPLGISKTLATSPHAAPLTPYTDSKAPDGSTPQPLVEPNKFDSSQVFQVKMGTVEGIVPGTVLCNGHVIIPRGACAEVSDWKNKPMILFVQISADFPYTADLFPTMRTRRALKFVQAASLDQAHIVLRSDGNDIVVEQRTSTMLKCQRETRFALKGNPAHLPDAMDGIAHFNYFLDRSNEAITLNGQFALEMHRLKGEYPNRETDSTNMVKDGEVRFASKAGAKYGFIICNMSAEDLFPYLFYFDPEEYTIQCFYKPAGAHGRAPLPTNGTLTIGMDSERAFEFTLPPGEESSSGFFKLFVQELSPFDPQFNGTRGPF
ncbi:hypothetical protein B0H13DRAFT_1852220 [Mycena leptocephala]|nr:hypothetical protein B0H13DRAFT_1852220 [Mycena leptocephala]